LSIDGGGEITTKAQVFFEHAGFRAKVPWLADGELQPELRAYVGWQFCECEVIGNIFDNPDLLK